MARFTTTIWLVATMAACAPPLPPKAPALPPDRFSVISQPAPPDQRGVVSGTVHQPDGNPLVGATLILESGVTPTLAAITDETGFFHIDQVPPGRPTLTLYVGSATHEFGAIAVRADESVRVAAVIALGPEEDVLLDYFDGPMVDTGSTQQGTTIERDQLTHLP